MVRRLLALPKRANQDASDALAVAICHLQTRRTLEACGGRRAVSR
jgi:Holliday junction resolvasome RuvABC endonuclease subunit